MTSGRIDIVVFAMEALTSSAFCALLHSQSDLHVVEIVGDVRQLLGVLTHHQPNVLVMVDPPASSRSDDVSARFPRIGRVVVARAAFGMGPPSSRSPSLHLPPEASADELFEAVRAVYRASARGCSSEETKLSYTKRKPSVRPRLTGRQREILHLVVDGRTTKEIALKLGLSSKTVETHRAQLMARLGVRDLASLIHLTLLERIIPPPRPYTRCLCKVHMAEPDATRSLPPPSI